MDFSGLSDNQVFTTIISLYGVGVLTFILRNIPTKIYGFLTRHLTTSVTITSQNDIFQNTMRWFEYQFKYKNIRTIKLSNGGRYGGDDIVIKSIGYGRHWLRYNGKIYHIELEKDDNNKTEFDKDEITITSFGRSHKHIDGLIDNFRQSPPKEGIIELFKNDRTFWEHAKDQPIRPFDTIFMKKDQKQILLNRIHNFIKSEEWYKEHGIPYQLGILLYGPPGTGKSSIIKALATELKYPIYYLDVSDLSGIEGAIANLPPKVLLVIEDIDSNALLHTRDDENSDTALLKQATTKISLSTILNSLDGIFNSHGRILCATTNHIDKLDSALLRPGRIDLKLHIDNADKEVVNRFLNKFYNDYAFSHDIPDIQSGISVADLQDKVLMGYSAKDIIETIKA